jgi:hypothetical protein
MLIQDGFKALTNPYHHYTPLPKKLIKQWNDAEIERLTISLMPLFDLKEKPTVRVEKDDTCSENGTVSAYSYWSTIIVCEKATKYSERRLTILLKHELIHVWKSQMGIKDNAEHGTEFMKKAIEVGTLPLDEDVDYLSNTDQ